MFPHTIDPNHSGYYMKMVLRRALNNIQVTISNRIISELIFFICQQNLVQLGMVPFMILDPFIPVFLTIGYLVSSSYWFLISFTQVVIQFSLTLNPSTVPCQYVITQSYFPPDFVSGEKYDIAVCLSPMTPTLTLLWHQTGQSLGT